MVIRLSIIHPGESLIDPSRMITEKRGGFAVSWYRRLMAFEIGDVPYSVSYSVRRRMSLRGPCMPLKGLPWMSAVMLGPVMKTMWLGG